MKTYLVYIAGNSDPIRIKATNMISSKEGVRFYGKTPEDNHEKEVAFFSIDKIVGVTEESSVDNGK